MHIWDEKPLSIMHHKSSAPLKMDYSHCPLKKRPVNYVEHEENMDFDNTEESSEPENLSTKPQDLSVKCKSVITAVPLEPKKEILSPNIQQPPHHYQVVAPYSLQSPYHPYQPTAIKPGPLPLAPLCLNIAGDHHQASMAPASAYHKQYTPATPRPVPAQYPSTGYLAGYMYQPHHDRGYSAVASAGYPQSMVISVGRDSSLSPSGSAGSAFKPLHTSPGSVATTSSLSPPALPPWYGKHGGWSPSGTDISNASPPLHQRRLPPPYAVPIPMPSSCSSTSSTGVSPPYAQIHCPLPPPPPAVPYQPMHCSVVVSTGAARAMENSGSPRPPPSSQPSGSPTVSAAVAGGARRKAAAVAAGRFKCPSCPKTYSTASGLTKHQQHHCADDRCLIVAKTFCCKYCDKAYNTLGALKMHIRTHTLPCICKLCGKAFSRPWLLQGHIRTHTGEKPFSCQHCNRAFADRSNLRAHLQTHSDVKKYSCLSCSKTFSRMSLLSKHCDSGCLTARMPPMPPIPQQQQQQPQQPQQQPQQQQQQQQPITI